MELTQLEIFVGYITAVTKRREIPLRRYEFWCHHCGKHYYRVVPDIHPCNNPNCKESILELRGIVELSDVPDGFMGLQGWVNKRYLIDKKGE